MEKTNRREFIKRSTIAGFGAAFYMSSGKTLAFSPNETVNFAIIGTGGRAYALTKALSFCENARLIQACDVDELQLDKFVSHCSENLGFKPKAVTDFRKILKKKKVDAILVATPEHWHAPMAIMAMKAGKHVYVEKPCSHNLYENNLLVEAQKKYGLVCQMGNQQRSSVTSNKAISDIRSGVIGDVYYAKAWYANTRDSIGTGNNIPVPDTLDWDLWQGPAPREDYRDNVHSYNWHWFKTWGTGEIHNNGTHEMDICRWALDVNHPKRVVSTGGRLHFKNDDWEFYDTQVASYEFDGEKSLIWEGRSCNGMKQYGRGRGAIIHGTSGTILLDRAGYQLLDLEGNELSYQEESDPGTSNSTKDTSGFDGLTVSHLRNFIAAIREGEALRSPIADASISTHMCHLGNIAQEVRGSLDIDPSTGQILNNPAANNSISNRREYESGWEPTL